MKKLSRKLGMLVLAAMMSGTALLATPKDADAQSPWWFYVDGGYSILTGDFSNAYKGGFTTNVAFGKILAERFALGLFGGVGFHSLDVSVSGAPSLNVWRYGLWGGVNALEPANVWDVWFGAGVGLGTLAGGGGSDTNFLLQGNLAVSRQVSPTISLGINGTFYIIFTEGSSWTGIPLTAFIEIVVP